MMILQQNKRTAARLARGIELIAVVLSFSCVQGGCSRMRVDAAPDVPQCVLIEDSIGAEDPLLGGERKRTLYLVANGFLMIAATEEWTRETVEPPAPHPASAVVVENIVGVHSWPNEIHWMHSLTREEWERIQDALDRTEHLKTCYLARESKSGWLRFYICRPNRRAQSVFVFGFDVPELRALVEEINRIVPLAYRIAWPEIDSG